MVATSRLGDEAETGTHPDSAPQVPLKTASSSAAPRIRSRDASGVPTMSTPRSTSSGLPSGKTRQTRSGSSLKDCGMNDCVIVKPPAMSSKISPYGLPCFLISSISWARSLS